MSGFIDGNGAAITVDQIRTWIANGQGFSLSLGNFSSGAGTNNYAVSIFNPANNAKNIFVYSALVTNGSGGQTAFLTLGTADTRLLPQ